jgi:hypothetical protein
LISLWKYHKLTILFILFSTVFYWVFAYDLIRTDFPKLLALYIGLFGLAYQLHKTIGQNFLVVLLLGIGFRLLFLMAIPNLSQDFYRFIWDGYLNLSGLNPYLSTPKALMENGSVDIPNVQELFKGMGSLSASNFSNYPPVNQFFFAIGNLFPGESILSSVIGLRLLIILADIGVLFIGAKLLKALESPVSNIFWYYLNPFIIVELTGNLHFEGVMIFFLILSFYLLYKRQFIWSAVGLGLSISVKLIPLMLLPLFISYFKQGDFKQVFKYYFLVGLTVVLSFLPFVSKVFLNNYAETIGLWFNNFEFNASIYYLLRGLGYLITGYNEIGIIGKIMPLITISFILYASFFKDLSDLKTLLRWMLFTITIYLLMSTTVHPWYLSTLILLSIFTPYRYALVWSVCIVLSYHAYSQVNFEENYWILATEYSLIFLFALWELSRAQKDKLIIRRQ